MAGSDFFEVLKSLKEAFELPPRLIAGLAIRRVYEVSGYPSDGKISRQTGFRKLSERALDLA